MIRESRPKTLLQVAEQMILAATTAPKARGIDNLEMAILERADIEQLATEMEEIAKEQAAAIFLRDAGNLREHVQVGVLIGTKLQPIGLKVCGLCGHPNCDANRAAKGRCVFNSGDLGIAIGSAVSVAASCHVDNRVMYTIGMAAMRLKLLGEEVKICYGIPLSATAKNPFFDRN